MSFSSKAFLEYQESLLEPDSKIRTGNAKRYPTAQAEKSKWLDSLTPEQREQLKAEYEEDQKRKFYY